MNKTDRNAKEVAASILSDRNDSTYSMSMEWKRSRVWGTNPTLTCNGITVAKASGCGYDKESAALVDFLSHLVPEAARSSGAGFQSVVDTMAAAGWELKKTYCGIREDGYKLRRAQP